jgi:LysR family nitrogen assimilation transcriptional regulator
MDLRRLRTFVAVAELGTVSKAALCLRISQPALSRRINDLEQEFGLRLFDRVGRRVMLTAIGEQLLDDCRTVLGQVDSLGARVELLRRGGSGVLRLAAPPQTIESVLSRFLPRYTQRFPNVHVRLTEALGHEQLVLLEHGEVHLGIRHDQGSDRRFESRALPADEVLAVCAPSLQLGGAGMIDIGCLVRYPLLLLDSGYSVRKMFDAACRLAEIEPKILVESRAPHTLLALAEDGHGVAIIPSILNTDRYNLRIARVAHRNRPLRERLVIQWDKRRPIPSYAQSFCELLAEYMGAMLPITQPSGKNTSAARGRVAVRKTRKHTRKGG